MKNTLILFLSLCSMLPLMAQQNLGIRNSNYAGIQGALLNPSSIADSKLKWDLNIFSVDEVFDNTFLFAPKSSTNFLGFGRIIKGSFDEDLFQTKYDPQDPNKLYNVTLSAEALGPSFFIKVAKKHELGLTISGRAYANIKNITGNLGQNAWVYFNDPTLWDTEFHDNSARVNSMAWLEYGLHYATVLYNQGRDELKVGISLNYLQGLFAAYANNLNVNYNIGDTANLVFSNTSVDYGRTDFGTFRDHSYHGLNHGHGFGMDIGFTYLHLKDEASQNYLYKIGLSLLDIGSINFNRNSAAYHLQTASADFSNWHQTEFVNNNQVDQTLSAIFYQGDSTRSLVADHFKMAMPSAISIQGDWNVCGRFFANATIIKGFGHGDRSGVTRPDVYAITPRYETEKVEVSLPMSLLSYGHVRPRLGIAARYRYFFVGGDAPGPLLKVNNLEGVDFYAGIHYYIPEKPGSAKRNL